MTKQEIKAKLDADPNRKNPVWDECFKMFFDATKQRLKHGCGGCYTKCAEWLKKP
jgi:hypothetical protein